MKKRLEKGCEHWEFNLQVVYKDFKNCSVGGVCRADTRVGMVSIPLITNSRRLEIGERLFLETHCTEHHCYPSQKPLPAGQPGQNWLFAFLISEFFL